jgi:hypothetical protein
MGHKIPSMIERVDIFSKIVTLRDQLTSSLAMDAPYIRFVNHALFQ